MRQTFIQINILIDIEGNKDKETQASIAAGRITHLTKTEDGGTIIHLDNGVELQSLEPFNFVELTLNNALRSD